MIISISDSLVVTRCINSSAFGTEKSSGTRGKNGQSWIGKKALSRLNSRILPLQAKIHVETWTPPLPTPIDFSSNPLQANKNPLLFVVRRNSLVWPDYNISKQFIKTIPKKLDPSSNQHRNPIVINSNPNYNFDLNPNSNANPKSNLNLI